MQQTERELCFRNKGPQQNHKVTESRTKSYTTASLPTLVPPARLFSAPHRTLDLQDLLADKSRVLQLVLTEAEAVAAKHGTPRRTRLFGSSFPAPAPVVGEDDADVAGVDDEGAEHWSSGSAEVEREVLLVYNQRGYVKRQDLADFSVVKKGEWILGCGARVGEDGAGFRCP